MDIQTSSLTLPHLVPHHFSKPHVTLKGDILLVYGDTKLACISVSTKTLLWETERGPHQGTKNVSHEDSESRQGVRRLWMRDVVTWTDTHYAAHVHHQGTSVVVTGHDIRDGGQLWQILIDRPQPADWDDLELEPDGTKLASGLVALLDSERLVLEEWRSYGAADPGSENRRVLELTCLDPATGKPLWQKLCPNYVSGPLEGPEDHCVYTTHNGLCFVDLSDGSMREIELDQEMHEWSPSELNRLLVGVHDSRNMGFKEFDSATGELVRETLWADKRKKTQFIVKVTAEDAILRTNSQYFTFIGKDLRPAWEARVKPFIYCAASFKDGPVWIGTSGRGGGLYAFDRHSGEELFHETFKGGVFSMTEVGDLPYLVGNAQRSVVIADGFSREYQEVKLPYPQLVGSSGNRVVVLIRMDDHMKVEFIDIL